MSCACDYSILLRLVHIHLGKAAGTSLRTTLSNALGPDSCCKPFRQMRLTAEDARYYDSFQVISGHLSRADQLKWFGDRRVITVMREPIDRALSYVHFVRSQPEEAKKISTDSRRATATMLEVIEKSHQNLHNTMVRQLGGHTLDEQVDFQVLLENAKRTLREALWVGRQDAMPDGLRRLAALLGRDLEMVRVNVTPSRPRIEDEDPRIVDQLIALNAGAATLQTP